MAAQHLKIVRKKLQTHVERGVFRNFREVGTKQGKTVFTFDWLENRPLIFIFDANKNTVQFKNCLPRVNDDLVSAVRTYAKGRDAKTLPAHRRIDPNRATLACPRRLGNVSLVITAHRNQVAYATDTLVNLLNEVFVLLHTEHFEYMVATFDISQD